MNNTDFNILIKLLEDYFLHDYQNHTAVHQSSIDAIKFSVLHQH